ncbi:hypothetical protein [Borrelia miyamotoi]|uniref:Uncharacterized protein n=1 Tax=Borrelia miyamotoi TaxID=47466 RepID=A0AAQ2WWY4_9SPIR|nr:hypothetical protein [Borrelia miyamotoi]AOW96389.1 hypothetical protein AXH25_04450 [Borrelia miyamotoi]WAZ91512.1 hypothetical protein O5398_05100 [Borrelia miyamotoi]WAZ95384.1 hypothetical protein O5397_05115 [Borrelia miyamotoi]WAZ96663.1 hypothetical protein O5405_05090 [Borrelia miyamotoi]WAZ97981.1 hypothetical protein O5401_05070 [Borrelia miyamotoi]
MYINTFNGGGIFNLWIVRKLFFKILFILNLLTLSGVIPKESEEVFINHTSNRAIFFLVNLVLKNDNNSFFVNYSYHGDSMDISVFLQNDYNAEIKDLKLVRGDTKESLNIMSNLSMSGEDEKWYNRTYYVHLVSKCRQDSTEFIEETDNYRYSDLCRQDLTKFLRGTANDSNLYFYVTCFEKETNVEREYCFKVSAVNFLKFVDVLNAVDPS